AGRRDEHLARRHGRGKRFWRLSSVSRAFVHHGQHSVGADLAVMVAERLPDPPRSRVDDHQHLLSGIYGQAALDDDLGSFTQVWHGDGSYGRRRLWIAARRPAARPTHTTSPLPLVARLARAPE